MKGSITYLVLFVIMGCSPYKKVVVTGSEQLTNRWKGQTEDAVRRALGSYKSKTALPDGFIVRYDYSYVLPPQLTKSSDVQVRATQQSNVMAPPTRQTDYRSPDDSVIRRMDFYFDKAHLVQSVQATGFPDSVYMVKKK